MTGGIRVVCSANNKIYDLTHGNRKIFPKYYVNDNIMKFDTKYQPKSRENVNGLWSATTYEAKTTTFIRNNRGEY